MGFCSKLSNAIEDGFKCAILPAEYRVNRTRYLANSGAIYLIVVLIYVALEMISSSLSFSGLGYISVAALILWSLLLSRKRLHDMNCSGWWLITTFIPGIGIIARFAMMLVPGTKGANKFGDQPAKSSNLVYVMAFLSHILIIAVSIIFANLARSSQS